ncbi:MAG: class I SAM-dependent methyltransferase [Hyphomicrobiaceae bacterium]|nr:MAG: class I SAM-dependent methyltransferase [Hyphomicrobiaceae bacterium]
MSDFHFTSDWFTTHIPRWEKHLLHLAGRPIHCLEIGTYEGRSACWIAQNLLTHPESSLLCLDPLPWSAIVDRWHENLRQVKCAGEVRLTRASSLEVLPGHKYAYDFIYVDGDHHGSSVIRDGINAWKLLRSGGIMIFDDYLWSDPKYQAHELPGPAIDYFLSLYQGKFTLLFSGWQIGIRKE